MDITAATLDVPYYAARQQFHHYREAIKNKSTATKDDVSLYRALRAILRGQKVLDMNRAIQEGGFLPNQRFLPQLAIARADWPTVHCWNDGSRYVFSSRSSAWGRKPMGEFLMTPTNTRPLNVNVNGRAQVPSIPPQYRPKGALGHYHILFEAEWDRVPPVDPVLVKSIGGPFFVVLAAWELTPLEQAVLRQKL